MSTIITPALVRRYLLASGWTVEQIGDRLAWTRPDGSSCWSTLGGVPVMLNAAPPLRADEYGARLGMLAAAEDAHRKAMALDAVAPRRRFLLREASELVELAGVYPEAWEEAKGR